MAGTGSAARSGARAAHAQLLAILCPDLQRDAGPGGVARVGERRAMRARCGSGAAVVAGRRTGRELLRIIPGAIARQALKRPIPGEFSYMHSLCITQTVMPPVKGGMSKYRKTV